jgi:hypothetical protein
LAGAEYLGRCTRHDAADKQHHQLGRGRTVAPDTFVVDGEERGHPHFCCDVPALIVLFAGLELLSLKQQQHRKPGFWHWQHRRRAPAAIKQDWSAALAWLGSPP